MTVNCIMLAQFALSATCLFEFALNCEVQKSRFIKGRVVATISPVLHCVSWLGVYCYKAHAIELVSQVIGMMILTRTSCKR